MKKKYLIYPVIILATFSCYSKVIIWDLGGVLLKTNKIGLARHIGVSRFLSYIFLDRKTPNIKPLLFSILDQIPTDDKYHIRAVNEDGSPLPEILCEWQSGKKSSIEISLQIQAYIDHLDIHNFFVSTREKSLIKKTIQTMFDPILLADNTRIISRGLDLLHECSIAHHSGCIEKHTLMIISNWDASSFSLIYNQYPELFKYFHPEHVVISGVIGLIKPDTKIFEYVLDVHNLNPEECVFIDDQKANVQAARSCGMTGIVLQEKNYLNLRQELIDLKILPH